MSYISLYRSLGHGAWARSLLLESPAGIPWEQEALVVVGRESRTEKGREEGQGQREEGEVMD